MQLATPMAAGLVAATLRKRDLLLGSPKCGSRGGALDSLQLNSQEIPPVASPAISADAASWYAVQTRTRCEKVAAKYLRMKGVNVFLPLVARLHRWSDRNKRVELPLFPGYEFVRIVPNPSTYHSVLQTPGIARFVGKNGENLLSVPDKEIDDIRTVLDSECQCTDFPFFKVGQRLRIRGGCLDGLEGTLMVQNNKRSMVISVELIHRSVAISIEGFDAEVIDTPNDASVQGPG